MPLRSATCRWLATALLTLVAAAPAGATVRTAVGSGLVVDRGPPPVHRGAEIRHALSVDRRSIARAVASGGPIWLPSTGDAPRAGRDPTLTRRPDGLWTVTARVDTGDGVQTAVLTLGEGVAFGTVPQAEGRALRIETREGRPWLVEGSGETTSRGIDYLRVPAPTAAQRDVRRRQDMTKADGKPNVDVLVLYTPTLVSVWGSDAAMKARIAHLEAITNQAYVDSDIAQTITIVGAYMVDYINTYDNIDALNAMTDGGSLPLARDAHRLRQIHGADLVALLREFDRANQTTCGVGWLGGYDGAPFDADWGFSVSADHGFGEDHCGEWTFSHELGHNMGAHHDFDTAEGEHGAYPYSRGYRRTVSPDSGFATVMAYNEAPQVRLGQFSNPRLARCLSQPCGDATTADNARGLTQSAASIAAFGTRPSNALPELRVDDLVVQEGNSGPTTARLTFTLSAPSATQVSAQVETLNGTALMADYVASTGTVVFPAGQTTATYDVTVRGDTVVERDEYFALNIVSATGAKIVDAQAVITIDNDEAIPTFSLADAEVAEGNTGTTALVFTATLSAPSTSAVTFDIDVSEYGIDGATAPSDYTNVPLDDIVIPAGSTSAQFQIPVNGDTAPERDERLRVVASGLTGAEIGRDWARGWIRDDDGGQVTPVLSLSAATVDEGDAGTASVELTASLDGYASSPVTFEVVSTGGTASEGVDYVVPAGTYTIPTGSLSASVPLGVIGDTADEPDETIELALRNVSGALAGGVSVTTVLDDDGALPPLRTRPDRWSAGSGSAGLALPVVANDAFSPARLAFGTLQVLSTSRGGTAVPVAGSLAGPPAGWALAYTPAPRFLGEESIRYRLCEGPSSGRCVDGTAVVVVAPAEGFELASATGAGWRDTGYLRDASDPDTALVPSYSATPLTAPDVVAATLPVDATPESPWDGARAGTATFVRVLPSPPGEARDWKVRVELPVPAQQLDLYVGIDTDLGQDADASELVCGAANNIADEPAQVCEIDLRHPGTGVVRYWIVVHNRSGVAVDATAEIFEVPLIPGDGTLAVTGPGIARDAAWLPVRIGWSDPTLVAGDVRVGYVGTVHHAGGDPVWTSARVTRTGTASAPTALQAGIPLTLALAPGQAHDRLFVDVPAGASQMTVTSTSARNIDLYLSRPSTASSPTIGPAPARTSAVVSATTTSGNETIIRNGSPLPSGRWYVTPVNADTQAATLQVRVDIAASAAPPRPGSYFNAARSGHGLFLYPAGGEWAGLWYTYLQDATPTWYYLQGAAPGGDGLWHGDLYRTRWTGTGQVPTRIGRATVTPTGPDRFVFTYSLDGETGSEPLAALGRGCPAVAGAPVDASSHWFNPATSGTGHSVQLWGDYEFYASFVYDHAGVPRFLTAESPAFAGPDATMPIDQLTGFCPLCPRAGAPARQTVGTLRRTFANGTLAQLGVTAQFAGDVAGAWQRLEPVQPLGGLGTTQGCAP